MSTTEPSAPWSPACLCRRNQFLRNPHAETQQGKYPMPNHHPDCDAFKLEEFARIELDGSWCILEVGDVEAFLGVEPAPEVYTITTVKMTRDQFEGLEEFSGF